jgi:hypothetical protein
LHDKIAQKQEDSTSSLIKIEEKNEQILQNTGSERCKSREKTQNATTTTREGGCSPQRPKALSES